jgi:hypothetical protein
MLKWLLKRYEEKVKGQNIYLFAMNRIATNQLATNRNATFIAPLVLGVACECLIWSWSQGQAESWEEGVRLAARFSGRFSFLIFLCGAWLHGQVRKQAEPNRQKWLAAVTLFAWVHAIHLGFVGLNVAQNEVELVLTKLIGGGLAYAMVLLHPIAIGRLAPNNVYHRVHYGYVGFVMGVTFLARLRGDFDGAENSWFQYAGLGVLGMALMIWTVRVLSNRKAHWP